MFVIQEFELVESEGYVLALPFDLEGGTQGETFEEAVAMAADWLRGEAEHWLMTGVELPSAALGHEPVRGGRVVAVSVSASLDAVASMSASEAADALGVSRPRVSQMLASGALEGWRDGRNTRVTVASVEARLSERSALRPVTA